MIPEFYNEIKEQPRVRQEEVDEEFADVCEVRYLFLCTSCYSSKKPTVDDWFMRNSNHTYRTSSNLYILQKKIVSGKIFDSYY